MNKRETSKEKGQMKPPKAQAIWLLKLFSIFKKRKEKMIYNTKTKKPFSPTLQVEFLISMVAYGGFQL